MGYWGASIFANDLALDIRGDWRELLEDGISPADATDRLIHDYAEAIADPDEGPVFWLALAASQWRTGRLQPPVKDKALAIIDSGGDIEQFAESSPAFGRQRARALAELATQLRGPARALPTIKRPRPHPSPAEVGDVILVRGDGAPTQALFLVVSITDGWPRGSRAPEVVGLRWTGGDIPSPAELQRLPLLMSLVFSSRPKVDVHMIQGPTRGPNSFGAVAEIVARGVIRPDAPVITTQDQTGPYTYGLTTWRGLAAQVGGKWLRQALEETPAERPGGSMWDRIRRR